MRLLFVSGAGIRPEQRIARWQMVSQLYAALGTAMRALGHQTYYYVHPDAWHNDLPKDRTWLQADHGHLDLVLESFAPDFVFCWNGSSQGDRIVATLAAKANVKMVYSEQGWFPQRTTLYFDLSGTNAHCSTRYRTFPALDRQQLASFETRRADYIREVGAEHLFDPSEFRIDPPDLSRPVFVPLQDERDLNIVQDSPFQTMDAFVGFLAETWPEQRFRVRPHPKYPDPKLTARPNVTVDDPTKPMFQSLSECGLVIGINSTTLLESALLGKTVVSFGESLATGTGLLHDLRPGDEADLGEIAVDRETARRVLAALLNKQMLRASLSRPVDVLGSALFRDLLQFTEKKPLQAWL